MATADPAVLQRLRAGLAEIFGERIERVVLFGSRARGDAREDSDYDVAIFLKGFNFPERFREVERLSSVTTDVLLETGEVISVLPYPAGYYAQRTPLMHEIRREGRDL